MGIKRVTKKLVPALEDIDAAIMVVNASDPQMATQALFYASISHLPHFTVLNKTDKVKGPKIREITEELPGEVIPAAIPIGRGIPEIRYRLDRWVTGDAKVRKVAVLGIFNCLSGDTEIIGKREPHQNGYRRYTLRDLAKKQTYKDSPRSIILLSYNKAQDDVVLASAKIRPAGTKEVYKITLADGRNIEATPEHKLFTGDKSDPQEVLVGDLRVGDTILSEDEYTISSWTKWTSEKVGREGFTEGAIIQMRKRERKRFLNNNPNRNPNAIRKAAASKHANAAYMSFLKSHMRAVQPLSPKGSYRKGRTLEECYGVDRGMEIRKRLSVATSGDKNPSFGKIYYPKTRFVGYLGHSVRSRWEEEICRLLLKNGISYQYEAERVPVVVNGEQLTYTPDIKLNDNQFIEIKGPLFDLQIRKMEAFVKTGRQLILITSNRRSIPDKVAAACTHRVDYGDDDALLSLISPSRDTDCVHPVQIIGIEPVGKKDVYDIHVPIRENFFLANGVLSHNSGKTSLINTLTDGDAPVGDIPGTTLEITPHQYENLTLLDTTGQIIDVSKPLMVSIDLTEQETLVDKLTHCMRQDAEAILASIEPGIEGLAKAVKMLDVALGIGGKLITCGAGASALVAMEIAGQAQETGIPVLCFTNNFATIQPVSFAKGAFEEESALAEYIARGVNPKDVLLGVSASGGTGFVYHALELARKKGAQTIAITENSDTPIGYAADVVIKSEAKPEGPSSSKVQVAHLALGHALILSLADERGVNAEEAIRNMLPAPCPNKMMGIK